VSDRNCPLVAHTLPSFPRKKRESRGPRSERRPWTPGFSRGRDPTAVFIDLVSSARRPSYIAFDLRFILLSERRQCRQSILPTGSRVISPALFVEGRGRHPFELMHEHELEGTVAKRLGIRTAPG
jgi:hypothetical protein